MLKCPKCYKDLKKENGCYRCENGHSYDISKEGYVNLMLANMKHSKEPGDSPESLRSREAFLNKGYYQPLAEELTSIINDYIKDMPPTLPRRALPCVQRSAGKLPASSATSSICLLARRVWTA